jgi:hypothetical protein
MMGTDFDKDRATRRTWLEIAARIADEHLQANGTAPTGAPPHPDQVPDYSADFPDIGEGPLPGGMEAAVG